jgi:hypothetical protein
MSQRKKFNRNSTALGYIHDPKEVFDAATDKYNAISEALPFGRNRSIDEMLQNHALPSTSIIRDAAGKVVSINQNPLGNRSFKITNAQNQLQHINNFYDTLDDTFKNNYGLKLLHNKSYHVGAEIPEDVIKYKVADYLTRAPGESIKSEIMSSIRGNVNKPNSILDTVRGTEKIIRSQLDYPDLLDRANFDRLDGKEHNNY